MRVRPTANFENVRLPILLMIHLRIKSAEVTLPTLAKLRSVAKVIL